LPLPTTSSLFFSLNAPPPTNTSTLSLHDALPIYDDFGEHQCAGDPAIALRHFKCHFVQPRDQRRWQIRCVRDQRTFHEPGSSHRSEEHTSELQSLTNLVCRLLLEKKKKTTNITHT